MLFLNQIDEKGRFYGLKVYINDRDDQKDTHGMSYLACRKALEEVYGKNIGLGARENDYE